MLCIFSNAIKNIQEDILDELLDKYVICVDKYDEAKIQKIRMFYQEILQIFCDDYNLKELLNIYEKFAKYKISINIPYAILSNEIFGLKNILLSKITQNDQDNNSNVIELIYIFREINNSIAFIYLTEYIHQLVSINNIRLSSISDLIEVSIIKHYESHIIWLTELALSIKNFQKEKFPQQDDCKCDFGIWLHGSEAKHFIQNNSKYKTLDSLHKSLHLFAQKIYLLLNNTNEQNYKEYHALISYLEKCELISLSIGTELALINNSIVNKIKNKDALTEALNRNGLKSIFATQYELSRATDNSFVVAMCDLDYFKNVNDTYGHIAGDKILQLFVQIVKKHIRNSDLIIRYGGEEFVIILSASKKEQCIKVLEKIREHFSRSILKFDKQDVQSTVSLGVIEITPSREYKSELLDEYLNLADKMLYLAKANGRNRIEVL